MVGMFIRSLNTRAAKLTMLWPELAVPRPSISAEIRPTTPQGALPLDPCCATTAFNKLISSLAIGSPVGAAAPRCGLAQVCSRDQRGSSPMAAKQRELPARAGQDPYLIAVP